MTHLRVDVVNPAVYTEVRTQGYRVKLTVSLPEGPISGIFGDLDDHLFVVEDQEWGGQQFLRVAQLRDLSLGRNGSPRLTNALDIWTPAKSVSDEMVQDILADLLYLLNAHTGGTNHIETAGAQ